MWVHTAVPILLALGLPTSPLLDAVRWADHAMLSTRLVSTALLSQQQAIRMSSLGM